MQDTETSHHDEQDDAGGSSGDDDSLLYEDAAAHEQDAHDAAGRFFLSCTAVVPICATEMHWPRGPC